MSCYLWVRWGARAVRFFWFVTVGSQGDHGMNRCFRSLSCVLTFAALALFSTEATARTKPKPTGKTHEAKTHAPKEARPHRNAAAEKRRHAKHADAQRKSKP